MGDKRPLRVAIVGGGLSGLCLANALLRQPNLFEVKVYERDTSSFESERGGYQIRLGQDGIDGLKACLPTDTYNDLKHVWGSELSRAPSVYDPMQGKAVAHLARLKLYPQTRAVPRQALKEYLLRALLKHDVVQFGHRLAKMEVNPAGGKDRSEVVCSFENGKEIRADLVIGADGSRSTVNKSMGINNVRAFGDLSTIQGRCQIDDTAYNALPAVLRNNGSILFFTQKAVGFCAVYEAFVDGKRSENESFLFWGVNLYSQEMQDLPRNAADTELCQALAEKLERMGFDTHGIPAIVRAGRRNVKIGGLSSSSEPHNWRHDDVRLGRVILIGDSVHAMTPGRGQGANQAMKDAGELAQAMLATDLRQSDDKQVYAFSTAFEANMFKRAFPWVRASEQAFNISTDTLRGYYTIVLMYLLGRAAGMGVTGLEMLGLKSPAKVEF